MLKILIALISVEKGIIFILALCVFVCVVRWKLFESRSYSYVKQMWMGPAALFLAVLSGALADSGHVVWV